MAAPVTQMIILPIKPTSKIEDISSNEGRTWFQILQLMEKQPGFQRLYWGRQLERENVELHVGMYEQLHDLLGLTTEKSLLSVKNWLQQHHDFLASSAFQDFKKLGEQLTSGELTIRHANLSNMTPGSKALGRGAPVTGTAIYLGTDGAVWDHAWGLWATIVPKIPGCLGVSGGYILEPVDGHEKCYIAWVGWKSVKFHDDYHHTKHFRDHRIILTQGNQGYREYGHVAFKKEGSVEHL